MYNGSSYTFHRDNVTNSYSWSRSRDLCEQAGHDLVSIESYGEWSFLSQTIQTLETKEYSKLKKDISSREWRSISDNSTVNASSKGAWPWAPNQPSSTNSENCTQMYKTLGGSGRCNHIPCDVGLKLAGYVCERSTECTFREGGLKNLQGLQKDNCKYTSL